MNEHKICFIICVNNNLFFEECVRYIHRLEVPDGVEVELLEIKGANPIMPIFLSLWKIEMISLIKYLFTRKAS